MFQLTTLGKLLYFAFLVTLFLITMIWDYFKNDNWALFENLFFSFWVASFIFMALLLRSKKVETEKAKNRS
ncbi:MULTISPECIES: RNA polymerase subunit sigma [Lysinibacillus]|nr:RNA polymerase subunit sigma [Lysinibacillus sphaericus]MDR0159309.1 RNA polymerase subunit sigma [Lysinibacillus sphaericus]MEB7453299.1 RNA polymerase subunit sigma [Lysinibacillus sphaericus]